MTTAHPLSSSPYQRVPTTPQVSLSRSHLFSSPAFVVPQQNLYSSPFPDHEFRNRSDISTPNRLLVRSQDDASLISEGAAFVDVEQVVPATPVQSSSVQAFQPPSTSNIQIPFTIDAWTSETPEMNFSRIQNLTPTLTRSILIPFEDEMAVSQEQPSTESSEILSGNLSDHQTPMSASRQVSISPSMNDHTVGHTPVRPTSRANVRQTPRRFVNDSIMERPSYPRGQKGTAPHVTSQTPRRLNVLLRRHATPSINRSVLRSSGSRDLDLFSRDDIFG